MDEAEKELFKDHLRRQRAGWEYASRDALARLPDTDHKAELKLFAHLKLQTYYSVDERGEGILAFYRNLAPAKP